MEKDRQSGGLKFEECCGLRQRACPLHVEVAEIKKQLEANKHAMELAAKMLDTRLLSMNEVREQLNRQAAETIRREEVNLMLEKSTATFGLKIKAIEEIVDSVRERENKIIVMLGLALFALCGNFALQLILHLAKH